MSIAILAQTHEEARRLAIAGSSVAPGDFRLKKLIPALEQAGAKAPVFAKVAQAAQAVVDSNDKTASTALLDLASLINAILYTQGETGAAGEMAPIESVDFKASPTQASARTLKPLLEALTTTGSGRLEIVRDAVQRGTFDDLRLVIPALKAMDDVYPEIAELVQLEVLPKYGTAIVGELLARLDVKRGRVGDVRRLLLLHRLDPEVARPLVKQALEEGTKEIRVAAIACLGVDDEDTAFLLEQATAKAKDVRIAALTSLTKVETDESLAILKKQLPKDVDSLIQPLRETKWKTLQAWVAEQAQTQLAKLLATKDAKEQGKETQKLLPWLQSLFGRQDAEATAVLNECFDKADALAKIKSTPGGGDVNESVAYLMSRGAPSLAKRLMDKQADLTGVMLQHAFYAAWRAFDPKKLYDVFAPGADATAKKKGKKSPAATRWEAIREALEHARYRHYSYRYGRKPDDDPLPELDPRWIDAAIAMDDLELIEAMARPGHAPLIEWLTQRVNPTKADDQWHDLMDAMVKCRHPKLTETVVGLLQTMSKEAAKGRGYYYVYHAARTIPELPATAIETLEALLSTLHEKIVDGLLGPIQELKNKHATAT